MEITIPEVYEGNEAVKLRYLPAAAREDSVFCFGIANT